MKRRMLTAGLLALGLAVAAQAQEPRPAVEFVVGLGQARAVPAKEGVAWANGGIIDVAQPNATTLIITMSGITATNANLCGTSVAHYQFDLTQDFGIRFNVPSVKGARLTLEGRVIGLLRTNHEAYQHHCTGKCGTAATDPATAAVTANGGEIMALTLPAESTSGCDDLSVYNHDGPLVAAVQPGSYVLHESWGFGTTHPGFFTRGASAEFAPQPAYYPVPGNFWFQHFQPFNGAATKDFGYQVTLKLIPEFAPPKKAETGGKLETKPKEEKE